MTIYNLGSINIDPKGEIAITIFPGANRNQSLSQLESALSAASRGDILLLQNETDLQVEAAQIARAQGLRVIYSAAPFDAGAAKAMMPHVDLLVMNALEAEQLTRALKTPLADLPISHLLITRGAKGATWRDQSTGAETHAPGFPVTPIDTTGAGDCFIGYAAAAMDQGSEPHEAMRLAAAASAIQVTRPGTADAIPTRAEVDAFLAAQN